MDKVTRRGFLKLGLTATSTALVSSRIFNTRAGAMELRLGGEDYIYYRVEERKPVPFACINCNSRDSALAYVNTESNRIVKIEGNPDDVASRGRCCPMGNAGFLQAYDPDRILFPMKRVGSRGSGKWKRISWDEAIGEIAGRIKPLLSKGRQSEIFLHMGRDTTGGALKRFMDTLGSPNLIKAGYVGDINKRRAMEITWGADFETPDFTHSRYILIFGANPYETSQTRAQRITDGRIEKDAKIVVLDVRVSNTAGRADEWLPIFPGTDGLVALAMANVIIEEGLADRDFINKWTNYSYNRLARHLKKYTPEMAEKYSGLPASDIRRIAIEFAENKPATVFTYRGPSSHFYGMYQERACMLLPIITGNVDVEGGYCLPRRINYLEAEPIPPEPKKTGSLPLSEQFPLSIDNATPLLPFYLKEGRQKISILFNYMSNPAYSSSAAAAWRDAMEDESTIPFIVDFSPFMSESASLADIILPDTSYLERYEPENSNTTLFPTVRLRQPVVTPLGESRETRMVLKDIIHRLDPDGKRGMKRYWDFKDSEDWMRRHFDNMPGLREAGGLNFLKKKGVWPVYGKLDRKTRKIVDKDGKPIRAEYGIYKKELSKEEMKGARIDPKTGVISKRGKAIGVRIRGRNYRGFNTPSRRIEIYAAGLKRHGFSPLPTWEQVPWHKGLRKDELVLVTFKWSEHNSSLTPNVKWLSEIVHSNPAWLNKKTAEELGIRDGDMIRITTPAGYMVTKAHTTEGIHPQVIAVPSSSGHWALGRVATATPESEGHEWAKSGDRDIEHNLWWRDRGVNPNDIIPVFPDPMTGAQTWSDTVVTVTPALRGDRYGDIKVHNSKHYEHYKEMLRYAMGGDLSRKIARAS